MTNEVSQICLKALPYRDQSDSTNNESKKIIYIKRARQLIVDDAQLSRPAFLAEVLAKTGKIYEMAEKKGQLQTMLNALRFACELTGIVK